MIDVSHLQRGASARNNLADDVAKGLSQKYKSLSSRYFYDAVGSKLFQQIMELPEYYPTRSELEVLEQNKYKMAAEFAQAGSFHLVDLGAGDALKTKILLRELHAQQSVFDYIPVDISGDAMQQLTESLQRELPQVRAGAVVGEYFQAMEWLHQNRPGRKVVLFLGSNIGNFEPEESIDFLKSINRYLSPGDQLLLGADLRKHPHTILKAYDDAAGVTAAFNLNLLHRINRELEADFATEQFGHHALYDPQKGVMRSYLVSKTVQQVYIRKVNLTVDFDAWEAIHTESSYKYSIPQVEELGRQAGFDLESVYYDSQQGFADILFRIR